jgi:hypothetical protein
MTYINVSKSPNDPEGYSRYSPPLIHDYEQSRLKSVGVLENAVGVHLVGYLRHPTSLIYECPEGSVWVTLYTFPVPEFVSFFLIGFYL